MRPDLQTADAASAGRAPRGAPAASLLMIAALCHGCAAPRAGLAGRAAAAAPDAPLVQVIDDPVPLDWRVVITPADRLRLARIEAAWADGLAAAGRRFAAAIRAEGALLDPAAALPRPDLPPGPYRCRLVALATGAAGGAAVPGLAAFRPWDCYVDTEGELLTLVKQTGSSRPAGRLWPDRPTRLVFLGAAAPPGPGAMAAARAAPAYADNPARDLAGLVERVGPFRWRLAMPYPVPGVALHVYELIPVPPAGPALRPAMRH